MSYPPYNPQGPGMYPPPEHMTTPLSYPMNPGAPMGSYPSYPANPGMPNPSQYPSYPPNPSPYPTSNPSMPMPSSNPYPGQASPYPPGPQASPYPSQNSAYPPQNSAYPPQNSAYPPQNSAYPPQNSAYPPQNSAYPPQASAYPPNPSYPSGQQAHSAYPPQASPYTSQSHSYQTNAPPPASNMGSGHQTHFPGSQQAGQPHSTKGTPTVRPANPFNPTQDAEILRKAMKGFGTDEKAIINVLANRTNAQRQEIAVKFKTLYGKDLIKDLKSELSGNFEDLVVALITPISSLLARDLNKAVSCIGTEEETIIEILCTATNHEIYAIRTAYQSMYGSSLEDDMASDTSGSFRRLLVSLCQAARDENYIVDMAAAQNDAQKLLRAGELRLGTDESSFNAILCSRSFPQLAQIFMEYQRLTGHDFTKAIENEFSGDIKDGLLAIVKTVRDRHAYFAEQLYNSMKGFGTKDRALQRIVAVRSEIDMVEIKRAFSAKYGKSLEEFIHDDTSGDYKKCLLALVSG
ncbi:hypothetical protein LSTR_LSTR011727 [Laodelphax striatellus]|uniref:Annexin n=1 Tax=Laodelphax striatellus TaxID=195883 RepID=A0A482WLR1_LAOST|nr:hypothetical protein LSTR_LSTR011727 [Laodelphax striatellus]